MTFSKTARILKRSEFRYLAKNGKRRSGYYLQAHILPSRHPKLGLTVSRRFGKSNLRNRFKRLVREAFRTSSLPNIQINITPQKNALSATFKEIKEELLSLTER
ncbi:MAG: Ribonuclease P protein component [Chlamydiales bacterium]|nr:Ribonuclease P protein component [Chlamydiales bacterium]MCH9619901.1 Ribonuclease P protein component [Chlamydiales bacterium]MCH9622672.1 Ribonuclease P protein component [Chlamydiales bacterium]